MKMENVTLFFSIVFFSTVINFAEDVTINLNLELKNQIYSRELGNQ